MQIDALRVFIEVVRKGSFTEAAKARDLSQSAVSQIVKQLEGRLGVQLINRYKQPVRPTKLGQAYCKGCEQLLEKFEELEASIRHANAQLPVHIGVAAIYSVGLGDMGLELKDPSHPAQLCSLSSNAAVASANCLRPSRSSAAA